MLVIIIIITNLIIVSFLPICEEGTVLFAIEKIKIFVQFLRK